MDDVYEVTLKNVCCTCLSTQRKLSQLCRIDNGVNDLFFLLSNKSEAYEAIFVKDVTQMFICWECRALMERLSRFREQACAAQAKLTDIADGKINYSNIKCLSKLAYSCDKWCNQVKHIKLETPNNFVDCGPDITDIKIEADTDDVPLAQLSYLKNFCIERETDELLVEIPDKKDGLKKNKRKVKIKDKASIVEIPNAKDEIHDDYITSEISNAAYVDKDNINSLTHKKKVKHKDTASVLEIPIAKEYINDDYITDEMSDESDVGIDNVKSTSHKRRFKDKDTASIVEIPIAKDEIIDDYSTNEMSDDDINIINHKKKVKTIDSASCTDLSLVKQEVNDNLNIPIVNSVIKIRNTSECHQNIIKHERKKCWEIIKMNDAARLKSIDKRKSEKDYFNALNKCESCIEIFEDCDTLEKHISDLHVPKPNSSMCKICKVFVSCPKLECHIREHYLKYLCLICMESTCDRKSYAKHLKAKHYMQDSYIDAQLRKLCAARSDKVSLTHRGTKASEEKTEPEMGTKPLKIMIDDPKGRGYACVECHKYFNKHVQKYHREGFQCATCGKKFTYATTLRKHEMIHCNPLPREQCPVCGKMVRADLAKTHAQTHTSRGQFTCVACDKKFVSRNSYEYHLKCSRSHVDRMALKHKCATCGKDYRSPGELRDHINYTHMGKTHHKCPVCDKALATARCVTRHVRRAHHGVKENARDKICQTCGKGFTCTKSLREHEMIHTGERPLSCDICARTFRQKACLYTHKRRVHKVALKKKPIHHTEDIVVNMEIKRNKD
ncbi:zinc finger protein 354B-like isoform X3 [Pararge aegeria]|uniref:zinc finger protein 354B-like isoform X3 n=1 Tax=Pararge aegeria TaxID=116150 RepID=UPI0019D2FE6D|nr:zinc finger protein 354B-like isoform X3 [Pararge aegeria]